MSAPATLAMLTRNREMANIVTTPMQDVFTTARHMHNAHRVQRCLNAIDSPSPYPPSIGAGLAGIGGQIVAPD